MTFCVNMPNVVLWNKHGPWESFPSVTLFLTLAQLNSHILSLLSSLEVSETVTNGEGTEGISNSRIPLCAACWWFQSGDCHPNEHLNLNSVGSSFPLSPMTALPLWMCVQKSSHCFKWKMKILWFLFFWGGGGGGFYFFFFFSCFFFFCLCWGGGGGGGGGVIYFRFPDLVWIMRGPCSYFSICSLKLTRL